MKRKISAHYKHALYVRCKALVISVCLLGSSPVVSEPVISSKIDNLSTRIFDRKLQQAQAGDAAAQLAIAQRLESGKGTKQDIPMAFSWYRKAADQGLPEAQYKVATMLETGTGTEKDFSQARHWYKQSAKQHYPLAIAKIASLVKEDRLKKEARLKRTAGIEKTAQLEKTARLEKASRLEKEALREKVAQLEKAALREAERKTAQEARIREQKASQSLAALKNTQPVLVQPIQEPKENAPGMKVSTVSPALPDPQETLKLLLPGNWSNSNSEVDFLPSTLSSCIHQGTQLSCFSHEREVSSAQHNLRYLTQSTIKATAPAVVSITYRYQVTRVLLANNSLEIHGGPNYPLPEKGWQETFVYRCQLIGDDTLECQGNKSSSVIFSRNTTTASSK